MSTTNEYRYPGVKPFEADDAQLFFGRDRDKTDLYDLICREPLTVLFAKSGYGKSSLLKAGLIPDLTNKPTSRLNPDTGEDEIVPNCPIYIRLQLYQPGSPHTPCSVVINRFREHFKAAEDNGEVADFLKSVGISESFWGAFKTNKQAKNHRIFLIFDQFEEFFSYPLEQQIQFKKELAELLYTIIPQSVRDKMVNLDRAAKKQLHQPLEVHALLTIRSDRMHLFNSMRDELPAILHARYELQALNAVQATDAILKPAALEGANFALKQPFKYEEVALGKILSELGKPTAASQFNPENTHLIETFQLQMVCQTIEQHLLKKTQQKKGVQPLVVTEADLPDFSQIYEKYYAEKMSDLPTVTREAAQTLLEEELVLGSDLNEMRRVSIDKDVLMEAMEEKHGMQIDQPLLDLLEDKFMLRRENLGGRVLYEISHDVLLQPIGRSRIAMRKLKLKQKEEAEAAARRIENEKRAVEAEQKFAEERAKRIEADRRRQKFMWLSILSVCGLLLALIFGALALRQQAKANMAKEEAVKQKEKAENALKAKNEAELQRETSAYLIQLKEIETILRSPHGCPDTSQMRAMNEAPQKFKENDYILKETENLKKRITLNGCQ